MHPTPTQIQTTALITELVANRLEVNNTLEELAEVSTPLLKEVLAFAVANDLPLTLAGRARANLQAPQASKRLLGLGPGPGPRPFLRRCL